MKALQNTWKIFVDYLQTTKIYHTTLENLLLKLLYFTALSAAIIWMLPTERPFEYSNLTVNSVAPEEIIAPFKFAIQKTEEELARERAEAAARVPLVFDRNPEVKSRQLLTLNQFFEETRGFFQENGLKSRNGSVSQKSGAGRKNSGDSPPLSPGERITQVPVDSFLQEIRVKYNARLSFEQFLAIYEVYNEGTLDAWGNTLNEGLKEVYEKGILDRKKAEIVESDIVVNENGIEEPYALNEVLEIDEARSIIQQKVVERFGGPQSKEAQLTELLLPSFLSPNLLFNEVVTKERKDKAIHDVPLTRGYVEQDERIVDSNEKITPEIYQKLRSLSIALKERAATQEGWQRVKFQFGRMIFAIALIMLTMFYIYYYRRALFQDNIMLLMITIIFLLEFTFVGLIQNYTSWPSQTIPVILAPMLLAMLLDFGVAFICLVTISLILGAALGYDYIFTFMSLLVGSVSIFSVQKIRNRRQMFRAILFILLAYLSVSLIFQLMHYEPLKKIFTEFLYYMAPTAVLTPFIVYFMIGFFERFFDVSTDITLLELSDLNHPLLKQLSVKAPGTFHHSILVANLSEAAAVAIGANALLTRVGSYFHDVGKMLKPEYFVENQHGGINKHDNLSPHMSYLILVNHVKEGVKMAERHKLPRAVKQFIAEHHGTTLISYFYHKALELAGENKDSVEISKSSFCYPGPKPQSKETAICMLADTVEAASRALKSPTPQRIRNLVDELVDKKIEEGQLDECDLTLKQIHQIKEAFVPILTGIHHLRIEYPENDREKKNAREKSDAIKKGEPAEPKRGVEINGPTAPKEKAPAGEPLSNSGETPENPEPSHADPDRDH